MSATQEPAAEGVLTRYRLTMEGTRPLLMHAPTSVNPLHPLTRELKALTGRKPKTEELIAEISRAEWICGFYTKSVGPNRVPTIPEMSILRSWQDGGKNFKKGSTVEKALIVENVSLHFDPIHEKLCTGQNGWRDLFDVKDVDGLPLYVDFRSAGVSRSSVMRTRPIFNTWTAEVDFKLHESQIDPEQLLAAIRFAGEFSGIGDFRPHFGRYRLDGGLTVVN